MNYIGLISDVSLNRNIIMSTIRSILVFIDSVTFSLIGLFYQAIFDIANIDQLEIFKNVIRNIETKIYVIIGILMIFKITISLLTYLANPDKINDKQVGGGKLLIRIVTTVVLLIAVPTIGFDLLNKIQQPLVTTIGKVVSGNSTVIDSNSAFNAGTKVANTMIGTFFYPNSQCTTNDATAYEINDLSELTTKAAAACSDTEKDIYLYTYVFGASNIVGLVSCILLCIIGINISIRAFKMIVLKVLAPIPILSYIDPKSAKDGMLSSYTKLFIKTYLDLFIQYGIFYLIIELIAKIAYILNPEGTVNIAIDTINDAVNNNIGIFTITGINSIFIIIGLLVFAIMAPKFINKALNIKDSEFGTGLAGMIATGSLLAGTAGATVNSVATSRASGGNPMQNIGAGIAGLIGGVTTGARAGFGSGKTDFSKIQSSITARNARIRSDADAGVNFGTRISNWAGETFMGRSPFDAAKSKVEALDAFTNYYASSKEA